MEYFLHLKPTFDCLANFGSLQKDLTKNKIHTFIINNQEKVNITFYPTDDQDKTSLPFAYTFCLQNQTQKKQVRSIKFSQNNYLIIIKPFLFWENKILNTKNKILNFGKTSHTLIYSKNTKMALRLENSQSKEPLDIEFDCKIQNLNTRTGQNKLLIYCQTNTDTFVVCEIKYSEQTYKLENIEEVDLLEEQKNKILTYKKENDFAGHGTTNEYTFENNNIEKTSHLVYDNSSPLFARQKEIIPHAFFDAVRLKNFTLARKYLSQNLNKKLTDKHLKKFFGNFCESMQTLSKEFNPYEVALIYQNKDDEYFAKIYCLEFDENNKITNIDES